MPPTPAPVAHPLLLNATADGRSWKDILVMITAGPSLAGYWIDNEHWIHGGVTVQQRVEPEASTQPFIHPRNAILHSNAGPRKTPWAALVAYMRRKDITGEPHFQVAGVDATALTGAALVQAIPLNRRADCNAKANSWWRNSRRVGAVSFESEDRGSSTLDQTPWSLPQLHAIIGALTAICIVYGVACTEPATWDGSGIGYHSRFPEWSIYKGKTCPGAARIRQMAYVRQAVAENLAKFAHETGWHCGQGAA